MDLDLIEPINLRGVKKLSLPPPRPKALSVDDVFAMMDTANERMRPWLMVNYLCLARPSEVVRVAQGWGEWADVQPSELCHDKNVFVLDSDKTGRRSGIPRHLVFSPPAREWLARLERCRAYPAKSNTCCDSLLAAVSQCRSSVSTPIALWPSSFAATKVDPDPQNGSRITVPPLSTIILPSNSTGFSAGWWGLCDDH